ncbi:MAG: hypothetical protein ACK4V2_01555 [Pseudomonadota bacterium]|jgi:hypothetical protein|nr:hypothetical protein [Alphaproteobacteria bacterium]
MEEPSSPERAGKKDASSFKTPARKTGDNKVFTPETVRAVKRAVEQSPTRHVHELGSRSIILTTADFITDEIPSFIKDQLIANQRRPFAIVVPFPGADNIASSSLISSKRITHLILTPTHPDDYDRLVEINTAYLESVEKEGGDGYAFLTRKYGTREKFSRKINHLYQMYNFLPNPLMPLFYELPDGIYDDGDGEPHFPSSVTYTILGAMSDRSTEVLGDIWLANIDESDVVCYKGTSERSTMVDKRFQSMRVGQTAVGLFNSCLVPRWKKQNVHVINEGSELPVEKTDLQFDGIIAYVEPSNFKSIGNNFRSGSFCIGAIDLGSEKRSKPMLLFRAPSPVCRPEHLVVDAEMQNDTGHSKNNLKDIWGKVKDLYPSRKAMETGAWRVEYVPTDKYRESLVAIETAVRHLGKLAPYHSEEAISGSPHFPRDSDQMAFSPEGKGLLFPFTPDEK